MLTSLPINIRCVSLNFQDLTEKKMSILSDAYLENSEEQINEFKKSLGFPVEQIAVVHKCNAIMLVFAYYQDLSDEYFQGRVLETWDKFSRNGITEHLKYIKVFSNKEALIYLAECVLGLHSVVIGDTQVFSQIDDSIRKAFQIQNNNPTFKVLMVWLGNILREVKLKTMLLRGNTSLERIACSVVNSRINKEDKVCLLGLGKSGKLIAKILSEELKCDLMASDINPEVLKEMAQRYPIKTIDFYNFPDISKASAIVLAITQNPETTKYCQELIKHIKDSQLKVIIDMASPAILEWKKMFGDKAFTLEYLSSESKKVVESRLADVNRAHEIIDELYNVFLKVLQKEINEINIKEQKSHVNPKINKKQIDLFKARNHAYIAIRKHLSGLGFIEINTPYIVGISTDPPKVDKGSTVDVLWPNGSSAFLRQSNQIYKQLVVVSGLLKIFEIGPFWRLETEETFRHLQETIGVDVEYSNPKKLSEIYRLAYSIINQVAKCLHDFGYTNMHKLNLPDIKNLPILQYSEAIEKLNAKGYSISYGSDLGLIGEAKLGQIIKNEAASDVVIIEHYPDTIKKFYTKKIANGLTETFDIIFSGWELVSGAIRETNKNKIEKSMQLSGTNIKDYDFYLSAIDGAAPHGGFCLGFDRLIAKLLNLDMIHDAVVFPRTCKRLIP